MPQVAATEHRAPLHVHSCILAYFLTRRPHLHMPAAPSVLADELHRACAPTPRHVCTTRAHPTPRVLVITSRHVSSSPPHATCPRYHRTRRVLVITARDVSSSPPHATCPRHYRTRRVLVTTARHVSARQVGVHGIWHLLVYWVMHNVLNLLLYLELRSEIAEEIADEVGDGGESGRAGAREVVWAARWEHAPWLLFHAHLAKRKPV
jgi:hypothetical protein